MLVWGDRAKGKERALVSLLVFHEPIALFIWDGFACVSLLVTESPNTFCVGVSLFPMKEVVRLSTCPCPFCEWRWTLERSQEPGLRSLPRCPLGALGHPGRGRWSRAAGI